MPLTRATKRRKVESQSKKRKQQKGKKQDSIKRPKVEPPSGEEAEDKILKAFDLDAKFGACIGITRMQRWIRAKNFGLSPPKNVKRILMKYEDEDPRNKCLWTDRV